MKTKLSSTQAPKAGYDEQFRLIVWLESQEGRAQSTVTCFRNRLDLEKRTRVMVNSTRYGPIGVKEVIDALRIAPDEAPKGSIGRPIMAGILRLEPGQIIQVLWRPGKNAYYIHPVTAKNAGCGEEMKAPLSKNGTGLVLDGLEDCAPLSFRKIEGKEPALEVWVGEGCSTSIDR